MSENSVTQPFLTTLGPWLRIYAVPDGHAAVFPQALHAGILYNAETPPQPVAFLWSDDGATLPGWALDIEMVAYGVECDTTDGGTE